MKKVIITYPDRSKCVLTLKELGLEDNATDDEISKAVDEEVTQNISWGHEVIED